MKKVLLVSLQKSGGTALDFLNFSNGLSEEGFFHIACISSRNEFREIHDKNKGAKMLYVQTHGPRILDFLISVFLLRPLVFLWKIIMVRADIIHVANFHPWILLLYFVRPLFQFKIWYACHDNPFRPKEDHPPAMDMFERFFARRADAVITYSLFIQKEIHPYVSKKVFVLPLIVPEYAYGALEKDGKFLLELRLLFFGRIEPYKGVDTLVDAYEILRNEKVPVSLVVAGRGSISAVLKEKMAVLGIRVYNSWISDSDLVSLLKHTDVVVTPYKTATQSEAALLALGYGIPVIATNVGSIPDYVHDGVNGFVVDPNKPSELALRIQWLAEDRKKLENMSKKSAIIRERFSPKRVAQMAINMYQSF